MEPFFRNVFPAKQNYSKKTIDFFPEIQYNTEYQSVMGDSGMKTKRWIVFFCTAALLQGVMLLFFTEAGLFSLYPLLFRASEEEYQTKGTYTVYFDMRLPAAEAPYIVVGMDYEVVQSYDAFQHLFRFIKQYNNIKTIFMDTDARYVDGIRQRMENPLETPDLPPILLSFADTVSAINNIQPPLKKCSVELWNRSGSVPEGSLILMDRDAMMEQRSAFEETGALCIEMKYINCPAGDKLRQDIDLPFVGEEVRFSFLPASRIDWFYDYYRHVTNLFGLPSMEETARKLDEVSADFVICIANGQAAALYD